VRWLQNLCPFVDRVKVMTQATLVLGRKSSVSSESLHVPSNAEVIIYIQGSFSVAVNINTFLSFSAILSL
jgi:hypothetical protein